MLLFLISQLFVNNYSSITTVYLQEIEKLQKELEIVKATCQRLRDEAQVHQETFETEKASWMDEKEKVIRYQKQLQLNYVQVNSILLIKI